MAYSKLVFSAGGVPAISDTNLNVITSGLDSAITYPTAGGTATAITLTAYHFTLTDGVAVNFVASASNSAAATTLNVNALGAKSVYKPGGTVAPNIEAGKSYTVIYNAAGSCFFVKANASGNAIVSDVLATKTFSNDSGTDLVGTMPNNAGDVAAVSSHSGGGGTIHIVPAKGYTDGTDDATVITDADFVSGSIKHGVDVFGIAGNYDTEAVNPIAAATVQKDKIGFVNGAKITGSLQPAATDIKTGAVIAGVTGTYDTEASKPIEATKVLDGYIGFVNGSKITGTYTAPYIVTLTASTTGYTYGVQRYFSYALDGVETYYPILSLATDITLVGHTSIKFYGITNSAVVESDIGSTDDGIDILTADTDGEYTSWINITADKTYYFKSPAGVLNIVAGSGGYASTKVSYALDGVEFYSEISSLASPIELTGHTSVKFHSLGTVYVGDTSAGTDFINGSGDSAWISIDNYSTIFCSTTLGAEYTITLTKGTKAYEFSSEHSVAYLLDGTTKYFAITSLSSDITLTGHTSIKFGADNSYVGTTDGGTDIQNGTGTTAWLPITANETYYIWTS